MEKVNYRLINHTADIGVEFTGNSLIEIFRNAALVIFDLIVGLDNIRMEEKVDFSLEENSLDNLFVFFLNELIYYCFAKNFLGRDFSIKIDGQYKLYVSMKGETKKEYHTIKEEIKAATFHNLILQKDKKTGTFFVRIIFDV